MNFRVGVSVADTSGKALGVNDDLCAIFGRTSDELLAPGIYERISYPEDLAREKPLLDDLLAGRRDHYELLKRFLHSDGKQIEGYVTVDLLRDEENPKAVGLVVERMYLDDLRDLLDRRRLLVAALADADAQLASAALQITEEEGLTRRELAHTLGVGLSTVQGWIDRARALR